MLAMVIAEYSKCARILCSRQDIHSFILAYAAGFGLRFILRNNLDSIMLYATYNFLVTLSPCGFIAGAYVLLGRLARSVDGDRHVLIPPQKIAKIFVASDVITFLVQVRCGDFSYIGCEALTLSAGRWWWYICVCGDKPVKGKPRS